MVLSAVKLAEKMEKNGRKYYNNVISIKRGENAFYFSPLFRISETEIQKENKKMTKKLLSCLLIFSLACSGSTIYSSVARAENSEVQSVGGFYITSNGVASSTIIIPDDASDMEKRAADELQYHVQKVSGATLPIKTDNALLSDINNHIVIATPDSYPELEELFADDITWLQKVGEPGDTERYGDDGFAIRSIENTIYIFGANARGALNGVYDFIEENLGVLWTRANEDIGLVYDEMPTIIARGKGIDNREKSPFSLRGWQLCGVGENGVAHTDPATEVMMARNKMNTKFAGHCNKQCWDWQESIGLTPFHLTHNVVDWILQSPSFDAGYTNYWSTDEYGNQHGPHESDWLERYPYYQINWWDQGENGYDGGTTGKTLQTLIDSVLNFLNKNPGLEYIGVGINDGGAGYQYPEENQDFEYAEGKMVSYTADNYKSTVCFSFINKVARAVKEKYPDVLVNVFAYSFTQIPPECEIEDNICVVFATSHEDVTEPIDTTTDSTNALDLALLDGWMTKSNNIVTYNYYSCFPYAHTQYERPIAEKIQGDMLYYVEHGFTGLVPEGIVDARENKDAWSMNALTFWLYQKLAWNPYEDIGELVKEFCDKCYGDASEYMQAYYGYAKKSWDEGKKGANLVWNTRFIPTYYNHFIQNSQYIPQMLSALDDAMVAANELEKQRIRYIKETFESHVTSYDISMRKYLLVEDREYVFIYLSVTGITDFRACEGDIFIDGVEQPKIDDHLYFQIDDLSKGWIVLIIPVPYLQSGATKVSDLTGTHTITLPAGGAIGSYIPVKDEINLIIENGMVKVSDCFKIDNYKAKGTYPTRTGKIFAGWYTDEELTKPLGANVKTGTAYAKFVDANVLDVKAQIIADTTVQSKKTDIRFVSTVNDLSYREVGFVFDIEGRGKETRATRTVYERLYAVQTDQIDTILPSEFSNESSYFYAYTYYNVPNKNFETVFNVTPYWITLDGTTVYGEPVEKRIVDGAINGFVGNEIGREDGEKW